MRIALAFIVVLSLKGSGDGNAHNPKIALINVPCRVLELVHK